MSDEVCAFVVDVLVVSSRKRFAPPFLLLVLDCVSSSVCMFSGGVVASFFSALEMIASFAFAALRLGDGRFLVTLSSDVVDSSSLL